MHYLSGEDYVEGARLVPFVIPNNSALVMHIVNWEMWLRQRNYLFKITSKAESSKSMVVVGAACILLE